MILIDSHAHLHFPAFDVDGAEVLKRAQEQEIGIVTVGTKFATSESGVAFADAHENVWCAIGLHPGHVHDHNFVDENEEHASAPAPEKEFDAARYALLVAHPKVVAIGEFGLDYSRIPEGMDTETFKRDQQSVARAQLRFATEHNKPVVIHCRGGIHDDVSGAHDDMRRLIEEENGKRKMENLGGISGVIHCFTGTVDDANKYAELGFLVSITGIVTFAKSLAATVRSIPLEQMMVETDCPYLSPTPLRGQKNEPANVRLVAQAIADLKGVALAEVARVATANAEKLFGIRFLA
jgi:TatD DNase family protein